MITVRKSVLQDNAGLLELTALTPMSGLISLRIDRHPDFFSLLSLRGQSTTFVAVQGKKIIGCISVSKSCCLVNGRIEDVYYLADLKIHPDFSGHPVIVKLLAGMQSYLRSIDADLVFCTAANGNSKVLPFFNGRLGFPGFTYTGEFIVYQLIPFFNPVHSYRTHDIRMLVADKELISFYNDYYSYYNFAPRFEEKDFCDTLNICAFEGNKLIASLSLIDTTKVKQNVLIGLPGKIRIGLVPLRLLSGILKLYSLPETGKAIKMLYIRAFAFKENKEEAFRRILRCSLDLTFRQKCSFLTIGIHEKDPAAHFFRKHLHFTFRSMGFITSMKGNTEMINEMLRGMMYEDYSLV